MKKRILLLTLALALMAVLFTGCAKQGTPVDESKPQVGETKGEFKDGIYLIKKPVSDHGNYAMAKLEVKDGKIDFLDYNEYLVNTGDVKNETNYPYEDGLKAIKDLNVQFNEKKDINTVDFDAVSGATYTKGDFKEVVQTLVDKAKKGEVYNPVYKDGVYEAKAKEASYGWLAQVTVKVLYGQIVGVDYVEVAVEDSDGVKKGDLKSADNYSFAGTFEVIPKVQKLIVDNNGTKDLKVDGITGATSTRDGMINLINEALEAAK